MKNFSIIFVSIQIIRNYIRYSKINAGEKWTATTEKLKDGKWDQSVFLPNGVGLAGHCLVQISAHETVMIGGVDANFQVNNNVRTHKIQHKILYQRD